MAAVSTVKLVADREPPRLPRPSPLVATLLSAAVGLWIAVGELDHLLSQVLQSGRSWSPNALTGPGAVLAPRESADGWRFLGDAGHGGWLAAYGLLDLLLALGWVALVALWLRRIPVSVGTRRFLFGALVVAGVAEVLVDGLVALGAVLPALLPYLSGLGWVGRLVAVGGLVVLDRARLLRGLRLGSGALYTHRYSALVVLPLGLLGLGRGPDLLEQVPDIERSWAEGSIGGFVAATVVMALLMVAVLVVGRQRTHHLWQRVADGTAPPPREPLVAVWLLGPAVLVVVALLVAWRGGPVSWLRVAIFCAPPVFVGVSSYVLRYLGLPRERPERTRVVRARFDAAAWLGDVLVGLLAVIGGLGAVRAFTAVVALGEASAWAYLLLVLGALSLLGTWPALDVLLRWLASVVDYARFSHPRLLERVLALLTPGVLAVRRTDERPMAGVRRQWLGWATLLVALLATAAVALRPVPLADRYGVIAVFQAALGSLSVLIAATVILFQPGGAPRVFWYVRLPFVPVTSLLVAAGLFAAVSGGGSDVHGIRASTAPVVERPTLDAALGDWLAEPGCEQPLPGTPYTVRPLLMYAAEGGGIRAAYWTASAVDRISGSSPCRAAFVSSGASGGSVGLSVASVSSPGEAAAAVRSIAGPSALGAASVGLVLRDTVYAATGVPLPSYGDVTPATQWSDRATLIEHAWEAAIPSLAAPFLRTGDFGPTGALVVNSTSTTTSCRALISQLSLPGESSTECAPGQPAPGSTDLVRCTGQLRTTTAALLTARFPYVTPSGVAACGDRELQVVDGGYAENFGLGTLLDLAPRVLSDVRAHNACVLAGCGSSTTLVVPQVVYLDNGTGSDLVTAPSGPDLELAVPVLTFLRAQSALYSARTQLERTQAVLGSDQLGLSGPVADAVTRWRGNPVAVVYQETEPGIAAPLGWVLSRTSMTTMDRALCDQDAVSGLDTGAARTTAVDPPRFGTIDDVMRLVGDTTPCRG